MPEKNVSEISSSLRAQFEKGQAALQQNNLDYALQLLTAVLKAEPAFFAAREALRRTQMKKAGQAATGFFKKMVGAAASSPLIAKAKLEIGKSPLDALATVEQILNSDPKNAMAHRILAEAAMAAGLPRTAILSLETLWGFSPGDKDTGVALAEAYTAAGFSGKSEAIFSELCERYPGDPILQMAYKNVSATRSMDEKGYSALASGQGSYRDILKDKAEAVSLEQEKREIKDEDTVLALIHEKEAKLQSEPMNLKLARDIAELYTQKKIYDQALAYYQYIQSAGGGGDSAIEKGITDVNLRVFDQQIAALDPNAPDSAAQSEQLKAKRAEFQLADVLRRVEKYPTDLQFRYELGVLYFNLGRTNEAISELQKAQSYQHRRLSAMNYLALCFARTGKDEMAVRKFQEAIKEKQVFDEEKKEMIYNLGTVLQKLGKAAEANTQFELIYQEDINYKDVAAKVDGYYGSK